jgi:hypothetical protein
MNLSITFDGDRCPVGQPVALRDVDTGVLIGCFASVADAAATRTMLEDGEYDALAMSDAEYHRLSDEMDALAAEDDDEDGWEPGDDPDEWDPDDEESPGEDGFGEGPSGAL